MPPSLDCLRRPANRSMPTLLEAALLGLVLAAPAPRSGMAGEADAESTLPLAPPGTAFRFEVTESHDAEYLGDTPAHLGKNGGLTVRPQVALGDAVYRTTATGRTRVGHVTRATWSRTGGSLEVEFDPEPFQRISVGDEVWIDLNPPRIPAEQAGE
ncbi:MAG: hypothetical protein ACKO1M_12000 [Planctomycetota bacterium]